MIAKMTKAALEARYQDLGPEGIQGLDLDQLDAAARRQWAQLTALENDLALLQPALPRPPSVARPRDAPTRRQTFRSHRIIPLGLLAAAAVLALIFLPTQPNRPINDPPTRVTRGGSADYPVSAADLSPLHRAAWDGDLQQLAAALRQESDRPTTNQWTALSLAAANGQRDAAAMLLAQDTLQLDRPNAEGETPLMLAAKYGHTTTMQLLLERGADIQRKNKSGYTALDLARQGRFEAMVHILEAAHAGRN